MYGVGIAAFAALAAVGSGPGGQGAARSPRRLRRPFRALRPLSVGGGSVSGQTEAGPRKGRSRESVPAWAGGSMSARAA